MSDSQIILERAGAYLFRAPTTVRACVDRNLLVVFVAPKSGLCALVLTGTLLPEKDLRDTLDNLFASFLAKLEDEDAGFQTKVFGAGWGDERLLNTALRWLAEHGLRPVAKDVGGHVVRNVEVHCDTGKVGVSYASDTDGTVDELLPQGSPRRRIGGRGQSSRAVVLSGNPVHRQLCRQSVEGLREWEAVAPELPQAWLGEQNGNFPYPAFIIFPDWDAPDAVSRWVSLIRRANPGARILWVGESEAATPADLCLPSVEPEFLGEFKARLSDTLRGLERPQPSRFSLIRGRG